MTRNSRDDEEEGQSGCRCMVKLFVALLIVGGAVGALIGVYGIEEMKSWVGLGSKFSAMPLLPWQKIGNDIDGEASGDNSGSSVSLSSDGKTVAIGAIRSGHARIFQWTADESTSASAWTQKGADIDGEASYHDYSGQSVSLSSDGKTVAIGAPYNNGGNGFDRGHVRIFQWTESASTWTQMGADIDGHVSYDHSGWSVSLSSDGRTVAVGAPNDDSSYRRGYVRIFQWTESTSTWTQMGADIDGEASYDESGRSVSLSSDGKTVAIGAPYNDGNGSSSGHVRIFQWTQSTSTWTQMGAHIDGEASGDHSGWSVSLSSDGKTVAVGAPANLEEYGPNSGGRVRIFQWTQSTLTWTQMGADIDKEAYGDESGSSVSLSSDGKTVAIGAPNFEGNAPLSGHVRIFQWIESTSAWTQVGVDIDGEASGDGSGWSVSLSSDGKTVAVGAILNDGNGSSSGHVRIFQWNYY